MRKTRVLVFMFVLVLYLTLSSAVYASPKDSGDKLPIGTVEPNDIGANIGGAYIDINSSRTTLFYSGNFSSANTWISASNQISLQWLSPLGGSWQTELTNPAVYSEYTKTMSTPTYFFNNVTWGYWRSANKVVAYWPSNILPSYLSKTYYSSQLYQEQSGY